MILETKRNFVNFDIARVRIRSKQSIRVDIQIEQGEFVAIVGKSGSVKYITSYAWRA